MRFALARFLPCSESYEFAAKIGIVVAEEADESQGWLERNGTSTQSA